MLTSTPCGRTGNRIGTQMRHPLLVEGRPNSARQLLASTRPAPRVAATSYCDPGRHANVFTLSLLTPCSPAPESPFSGTSNLLFSVGKEDRTFQGWGVGRGLEWGASEEKKLSIFPKPRSKVHHDQLTV